METLTLPSGRSLALGLAPFALGTKLFKQVLGELRSIDIDVTKIDLNIDISLATLNKVDPKILNLLKNVVCEVASNDAIEATLFECFGRCTIDNKKIDRMAFEQEDARADYLPAAWEVIKFNLTPFFRGLASSSLTNAAASAPDQR